MKAKWIIWVILELIYTFAGVYLLPVNLWFAIGFWIVLTGSSLYFTIHNKEHTIKEGK